MSNRLISRQELRWLLRRVLCNNSDGRLSNFSIYWFSKFRGPEEWKWSNWKERLLASAVHYELFSMYFYSLFKGWLSPLYSIYLPLWAFLLVLTGMPPICDCCVVLQERRVHSDIWVDVGRLLIMLRVQQRSERVHAWSTPAWELFKATCPLSISPAPQAQCPPSFLARTQWRYGYAISNIALISLLSLTSLSCFDVHVVGGILILRVNSARTRHA